MGTPGFSGRVLGISPTFEQLGVARCICKFGECFGRGVRFVSKESPVTDLEYFGLSISAHAIPQATGNVFQSSRSSSRLSASNDRRWDVRLCYVGRSPVKDCHSFGAVRMVDIRARHTPHVSASPAADMDSKGMNISLEESVGMGEDQHLTEELPPDLRPELIPKHVAIIMDGNSRWAERRGMHASFGHHAGVEALKQVAISASQWGVAALTVFAFSTENWRRPKMEVNFLMNLFEAKLQQEMESIMRYKLKMRFIGDLSALPLSLQNVTRSVTEITSSNTGMIINFCISYSGRADLVRACQQIATQVAEGTLNPADIDDVAIGNQLFMSELGALQDPDLVIRTSGEQRISNFLLWQVAYSEFVFIDTLWPDFGKEDFRAALATYQRRDRRYGLRDAQREA